MRVIRQSTAAAVLIACVMAATSACIATNRPPTGRESGKQPIVFIHGYTMQNVGMWSTARLRLQAAGYAPGDFYEFNYNSTIEGAEASARKFGRMVSDAAAQSPTGKVDIIGHSEGNLVAQTCMFFGECEGKVDHWVNHAGAQNGTALASAVIIGGGGAADMNPLSLLVARVNAAERQGKLSAQGVKTIVFWTTTDGIIIPGNLSMESYAKNVMFIGTHFTVYLDAGVLNQTVDFLRT